MRIKLIIKDEEDEPIKSEYSGAWCLEKMIGDLLEKYYGGIIKTKVIDLLRERIKEIQGCKK